MPTYEKNIHFLKEALFAKLNGDSTLKGLLGSGGRIFHRNPPKNARYPCLVYAIISDTDNIFDETQPTGEVTQSFIRITIFDNHAKTVRSDNIEARVKTLLHGQRTLDTTKIICYSCFRDSLLEPTKDPELFIWMTPIRYRVQWATK